MLDWLRFIGDFLLSIIESVRMLMPMLGKAVITLQASFGLAPPFLSSIMFLMFAVIIVMWVVNIF